MLYIVLIVSIGLVTLGLVRFISFSLRLKRYKKTKAEVTNIIIEKPPYRNEENEDEWRELKVIHYYSPEITYQADDLQFYTGNWWTQKDGELPYNIGEKITIYYDPKNPVKFFLYDRVMMLYEPWLLIVVGLIGSVFSLFNLDE